MLIDLYFSVESWEHEANERIENLRKRNVTIYFENGSSGDGNEITLEIQQKNHLFPFGTAVKSHWIADCLDENYNDGYCTFVNENYNWLVANYQ